MLMFQEMMTMWIRFCPLLLQRYLQSAVAERCHLLSCSAASVLCSSLVLSPRTVARQREAAAVAATSSPENLPPSLHHHHLPQKMPSQCHCLHLTPPRSASGVTRCKVTGGGGGAAILLP